MKPNMKTSVKITLFVVFFIAVAGIGVALYLYNLKPADLSKVTADYTISSSTLLADFEKDEAAATTKYVNKVIEVTGIVATVLPGSDNSLTVSLLTGNKGTFVICTFVLKNINPSLKVGENITVRGKCSGYLMDVLMNDCVLKAIK